MRCIFCLQNRPATVEHVFPSAIGGRLITDRVFEKCNSTLGSRVDAALSDFFPIRNRRAQMGLAGNSGAPPSLYEMLLGVAQLADNSGRRVRVTFDRVTGKLETRALHHASDVILPDGSKARQIILDERDADQLPKIIQRERKRHGAPPLAEEQLAAEVEKAKQNVSTIERPSVLMNMSVSFAYLRHAMMKIAYELAFLWLGESYLDDPTAAVLRDAICDSDIASTNNLPGYVGDAAGCEAFKLWSHDKTHHIAFSTAVNGSIMMGVRVFDIQAALVEITKDARRYLMGPDAGNKLRFLAIEPTTGKMRDVPIMDEWGRFAVATMERERSLSEPSPE
jgi:hypothetical protein